MIGQMDRKATLANPEIVKSASGGTTNLWVNWGTYFGRLEREGGNITEQGLQHQHVQSVAVTMWYCSTIAENLSKDSRLQIRGRFYRVTDFDLDHRENFVRVNAVSILPGSAVLAEPTIEGPVVITANVRSITHDVTGGEAGGFTFVLSALVNKTIINVQSGRYIPMEVITEGIPDASQILYTAETGMLTVSADAPLIQGERFFILYK